MEASADIIFAFRGSLQCFAQWNSPLYFLNLPHYIPLADRPSKKRKPLSGKPPDKDFLNSLYFFRMTTFLLQCDQSICNICNSAVSIFCNQEIIFLTDAADSRNVNSRFDRMNHSRLKGHFTAGTDIRLFMNIQSEVVSRTMWNMIACIFYYLHDDISELAHNHSRFQAVLTSIISFSD